jgi:hypothetical protein
MRPLLRVYACPRCLVPGGPDWEILGLRAEPLSTLDIGRRPGAAHSALGPGVPDPQKESVEVPKAESRHRLAAGVLVLAKSVLGGLHHEYSLAAAPATA